MLNAQALVRGAREPQSLGWVNERASTMMRGFLAISAASVLCAGEAVSAADYHVAQQLGWASDNNPGTEARPWKSIGKAAQIVQAGDTVVIHAGTYPESIIPHNQGTRSQPITFKALGDEQVILEGADTIGPEKWQPIPNIKNVYSTALDHDPGQVFVDDKPVYVKVNLVTKGYPRRYRRGSVTEADKNTYQYVQGTKRLLLNLGGESPGRHVIRVPNRLVGFDLGAGTQLIGIHARRYHTWGISVSGDDSLVQDCEVTDSADGIVVMGWDCRGVTLRRNTVVDVQGHGILLVDRPTQCVVEDNLVVRCTLNSEHSESWLGSIKMNSASEITFAHNVVLEAGNPETDQGHDGSGFWGDIDVNRIMYVGNTAANNKDFGLYVEFSMTDTRAYFNSFYRNGHGISCRQSQGGVFMRNLVQESVGSGLAVWAGDAPYSTTDNLFTHNLVRDCNPAIMLQIEQPNFCDYNTYWPKKGGDLAKGQPHGSNPGASYMQLADWVNATGHDAHSTVRDAQPADVGLDTLTFRVADAKDPNQILMMIGNGGFEYADPISQSMLPYFWRAGTGDDVAHKFVYPVYAGLKGGADTFAFGGAGGTLYLQMDPVGAPNQSKVAHTGLRCIKIDGQKPAEVCLQGLGFWSPSLPARAGDTFDVSYFVKGQNLKPTGATAIAAFAEFTNATGQHRHRVPLPTAMPPSPTSNGTFDWTQLSAALKVPQDSKRMRLFIGLAPAAGTLFFDDITIKVR